MFQKSERRKYLESRGKLREDEPTPPPSSEDDVVLPIPPIRPAQRKSKVAKKKNKKTPLSTIFMD